ncbi:hypothetical protein LXL04_030959 [Taraxacum kok-saghyz]
MASSTIFHLYPFKISVITPPHRHLAIKCTSNSSSQSPDFPSPADSSTTTSQDTFPIEKRRRSEILRDRRSKSGLVKPEPPNFEVGWKRTVPIPLEKPVGYVIMDFLEKLEELMGMEYGSTALLAKAGEIVAERAREEAEDLRDDGKVEERVVTELCRVLKLMEMDLAMVKAAVKEDTLNERLQQAKARCRQAILVARTLISTHILLKNLDLDLAQEPPATGSAPVDRRVFSPLDFRLWILRPPSSVLVFVAMASTVSTSRQATAPPPPPPPPSTMKLWRLALWYDLAVMSELWVRDD